MIKLNVYDKSKCLVGVIESKQVGYPSTCEILQPSYNKTIFFNGIGDAVDHAETMGYGVEVETGIFVYTRREYVQHWRKNNKLEYNNRSK